MVSDVEELEKIDASEIHARRIDAKEVTSPKIGGNFVFKFQDGDTTRDNQERG